MNRVEAILKSLGEGFMNYGDRNFVYGSQGKLLRRNMESLWFDYCVVAPPYNVFFASDNVSETLETLQASSSDTRPFGLADLGDSKISWNTNFHPADCKSYAHKIARVAVVTDEDSGKDLFHRKQRERKVWWRKFARNPSRFTLADARKIAKNRDSIDIMANFSFGSIVLETIVHHQDAKKIYPQIAEQKNDSSLIHVVEHTASLDWGCLAMVCDAHEMNNETVQLKIHPKLSPYKIGFYLEDNDKSEDQEDPKNQEKTRLVVYLNNLLKAKGLVTILTRTKGGIENYHVPMIISVDDESLLNGIVRVTSQLTTIAEAVHVTDLPKYVAARCA